MDKAKLVADTLAVFPNSRVIDDLEHGEPGNHRNDKPSLPDAEFDSLPVHRGNERTTVPSLDLWTLEPVTNGYVELKITDFGGGYCEATAMTRQPGYRPPRAGAKRSSETRVSRDEMSSEDRIRSAQRAVKSVRHKVKALGADRILTLTTREYLTDPDKMWSALKAFHGRMKKAYGDRWAYVAVPELHKSGTHWHIHLAIRGHLSATMVRSIWHDALRKTFPESLYDASPGNIDIAYKKNTYSARLNAISRYISKYISKALDSGFIHAKRYGSTQNVPKPNIHRFYLDLNSCSDLTITRKIQEISNGALSRNPMWAVYGGNDCLVAETEPLTV